MLFEFRPDYRDKRKRELTVRIIYLGTPEFAVPTLNALIEEETFEVLAVLCQPDRPKGRGNKVQAPPVKEVALKHNIKVLQPEKLSRDKDVVEEMRALKPDVLVMVAFGQILKKPVLEMAPHGVINLHGSLLPELRGAAPINWSIIRGMKKTGNTTMCTEAGVDTGPMLLKNEVAIDLDMDAPELSRRLAESGAPLMVETLKRLRDGTITPEPQDDSKTTYAPLLSKEMGEIDWRKPALEVHNLVRGLAPWPGTFTTFRDQKLKIIRTRYNTNTTGSEVCPGSISVDGKQLHVACGENGGERLEILTVQPPNKPKVAVIDWINGQRVTTGEVMAGLVPDCSLSTSSTNAGGKDACNSK